MDVHTHKALTVLVFLFLLIQSPDSSAKVGIGKGTFSVMTYNLENLYDHLHDEGKSDWSWTPREFKEQSQEAQEYCSSMSGGHYRRQCFELDWTQEVSFQKAKNLAKVILSAGSPDILVFQEVENIRIVSDMVNRYLTHEGYRHVSLIEGPDTRGIDVAIVSKLPIEESPIDYPIDLSAAYPGQEPDRVKKTRGILSATFRHGKNLVTILANHWPSQRNPDQTRVIAAEVMLKAISEAKGAVISTGDFNTMEDDGLNAINSILLNEELPFYCLDAEKVFFGEQRDENDNYLIEGPNRPFDHRGTHYYRGEWSSLDRIFVPRVHTREKKLRPLWQTYKVVHFPFMFPADVTQTVGKGNPFLPEGPLRFDAETGEGFSDHLPVVMEFGWN